MDVDKLLHALNNDENLNIIDLDFKTIAKEKNDVLQKLQLDKDYLKQLHKSLKMYRYVDTVDALHYGAYVRWITLTDPEHIQLRNGGIICEMKVIQDSIHIKVKNNLNRIFQFNMNEVFVFQKLNPQEQVILKAMKLIGGGAP